MSEASYAQIEKVARESYGRLLAYIVSRSGDVASAEDALGEALHSALRTWPDRGLPDSPEAWLLRAARNRLLDEARHRRVAERVAPTLWDYAQSAERALEDNLFPDDRLKMMFVCSHPAIDRTVRTPLMLQTVLGLEAARIAPLFLVSTTTMSQRLVRAKSKIRLTGLSFDLPAPDRLAERLEAVLEAVYGVYSLGWEDTSVSGGGPESLATEAVWLARLLVRLMPGEPEALGLLALILYCEARRGARRTSTGAFVALDEQDTSLWSGDLRQEAEVLLRDASVRQSVGRFQLEAAIQSAHMSMLLAGNVSWEIIARLYDRLVQLAPTVGAEVARAVAYAKWQGASVGLELLEGIDAPSVDRHQPYWAALAHVRQMAGRTDLAAMAYDRAISLAPEASVRQFLLGKREELLKHEDP